MDQNEKPPKPTEQAKIVIRYRLDSSSAGALRKLSKEVFKEDVRRDEALLLSHKILGLSKR